jgi:hypothetical protein
VGTALRSVQTLKSGDFASATKSAGHVNQQISPRLPASL